ncbi:hypothetical protein OPW19_18900 [Vibrio europaeus]|uniref:hypothetical protein n=1 Tax=Vibrio europaeus TaxID=300876 RepID=UPI00233F6BB5|nr:hypothetical protein [Vibrio europaeus]MDC5821882.1 hypothetical protein [Vibrio europaeus]
MSQLDSELLARSSMLVVWYAVIRIGKGTAMKSTKPITKARNAKIESMKAIKAAYLKAIAEGSIKTYRITLIR